MSDLRDEFLTNVVNQMILSDFNTSEISKIKDILIRNLSDYELTSRCTDIVTRDDNNLDQILKIYIGTLLTQGKRQKTAKKYYGDITRFAAEINKPILSVNRMDILGYLANKRSKISLRTLDNYRSALLSFYGWLHKEKIISENPMEGIDSIKYPEAVKTPFSDCEIDAIRYACNDKRARAIVELFISSGIRSEELRLLNINDIDFHNLEVLIRDGKGGKQRIVYINAVAAAHLKAYLNTREDNDICLFYSRNHCRLSKSSIGRDLKNIEKVSGVKNIHPHRFRHTFARNCIRSGMDVRTLQILLGHDSLNTTMKYVHFDMEHIKLQYQQHC